MNTRELRFIDEAIAKILRGPYYNADTSDVEQFQNDVRTFIAGKIKIEQDSNANSVVSIVFPEALGTPAKKPAHRLGGGSKLTEDAVRYIKENETISATKLAKKLGVSDSTVNDVRQGRTWAHVDVEAETE